MGKLIDVPTSYLPAFLEMLDEGLTLGPLLRNGEIWGNGSLAAWVPDSVISLPGVDLNTDVFYPEALNRTEELVRLLADWLVREPGACVVGETNYSAPCYETLSATARTQLSWLAVDNAVERGETYLCVSLQGSPGITDEDTRQFLNKCSGYPTVIAVYPQTAQLAVRADALSFFDAATIKAVAPPRHVVVGIFDETSVMIWSQLPRLLVQTLV